MPDRKAQADKAAHGQAGKMAGGTIEFPDQGGCVLRQRVHVIAGVCDPAAALATVVGVLVEVPVMLSLVAFANRTRARFG